MKTLITFLIGLILLALCASCSTTPVRIHADIVKDQLGTKYATVNDSVVWDGYSNTYYSFRAKSYQYIKIE